MAVSKQSDHNLHGNIANRSTVALLLVDVINPLDFPDNEQIVEQSSSLASALRSLKERCRSSLIPVIYANDNFGKWRSDYHQVLANALSPKSPGRNMVSALIPTPFDYVVLKPKHSAFYATPLDILLATLGVKVLILAGISTGACVLMTASDAYVRNIKLFIPSDCVAALNDKEQRRTLGLMKETFNADLTPSHALNLKNIVESI